MKKLNVAIVGFGFMGRTHYGVWRKMRNARVACVCDSNLAQITARTKGNLDVADNSELPASVRVYESFDAMLAAERLDVVDITLPTGSKFYIVKDWISGGVHYAVFNGSSFELRSLETPA